jgi:hypothetical protein
MARRIWVILIEVYKDALEIKNILKSFRKSLVTNEDYSNESQWKELRDKSKVLYTRKKDVESIKHILCLFMIC